MKPSRTFLKLRNAPRKPLPDQQLIDKCAARLFASNDGQIVLAWLRVQAERVLPADVTDGALRMHEGERQLVRKIEGLIENGAPSQS